LGGRSFLIQNVRLQKCIHASTPNKAERVRLSECKAHSPEHQWSWDGTASAVVNQHTRECLTVSNMEELAIAQLAPCKEEGALQAWSCSKKGHLTLQGHGLHLSAKPGGHSAFLSWEKDRFSKWKTGTGSNICATE
ncbi:Macrophage mannose receptor 1, partial [Ophiophagus hannah]